MKAKADITSSAACFNPQDFCATKGPPSGERADYVLFEIVQCFSIFLLFRVSKIWLALGVACSHATCWQNCSSCPLLQKFQLRNVEQNNFSQFLQVRRREKKVMFLCLLPFFQTLYMSRILAHYSVPLGKLNGAEHLPWWKRQKVWTAFVS